MKKILLTIIFIMAIFQMVVLAIAIDIGNPAIDRDTAGTANYTIVDQANPANATGTITSIEIWANTNMLNCEVATFYIVEGNNLSTRDTHTIGSVTSGSKQTFSGLSIDVQAGDYIGLFSTSGGVEYDNIGEVGRWYKSGDNIPCTNQLFTYGANHGFSLYGIGATAEEEEANVIFFGTNF